MKSIILLRHAKSDWTNPQLKDYDRPLNARGTRVAPKMGGKLSEMNEKVDVIFSSPAERAKLTSLYVSEQLQLDENQIEFESEIYEASVRTLLNVINKIDDEFDRVMLVGHNPTFSYIAEYLTDDIIGDLPTCGAVKISFATNSWKEISESTGNKEWYIYPKMFDF